MSHVRIPPKYVYIYIYIDIYIYIYIFKWPGSHASFRPGRCCAWQNSLAAPPGVVRDGSPKHGRPPGSLWGILGLSLFWSWLFTIPLKGNQIQRETKCKSGKKQEKNAKKTYPSNTKCQRKIPNALRFAQTTSACNLHARWSFSARTSHHAPQFCLQEPVLKEALPTRHREGQVLAMLGCLALANLQMKTPTKPKLIKIGLSERCSETSEIDV